MDRLERAVGRNTVEGIAHGTTQFVIGRKACNTKRRGRLERTDIGDLAHQARKVTASRGVADHIVDLAGLERLKALVDVGVSLLVGGDALLSKRLLRGRGHLDTQSRRVKGIGGNAQRPTIAGFTEHGSGIVQAGAERANVPIRGVDLADKDISLFVTERGTCRGRIDKGDLKAHAACEGAGSVDCIPRELAVSALHGLRRIGGIEGNRQGTGGDQGIIRHRGRDGLVLDLVDRGSRERRQRVERASAQAQNGDDRCGPST